jgi:uncharacterized protein YecE (DUF72 family)
MIYIGTSGWQYKHWRRAFYPDKLPQREWLPYYAQRFRTVEVNNTFYNLPERSVFEQWQRRTPDDFIFALKMSRYLTHLKRLHDPADPVRRFMERAAGLGPKGGTVLLQLPPNFHADLELLDSALSAIGGSVRVAVELRHESWFVSEIRNMLERRNAALCLADSPSRKQPHWRTAEWGFVRFHEGKGARAPGYETASLSAWVRSIADMWGPADDVFAYFNNDTGGYALKDAVTFAELAVSAGLNPTRVPNPDDLEDVAGVTL